MSVELCVLASGSGGNCTLLRTPAGTMLLDAGIGPRSAARRMNGTGASLDDVRAICLTHLDRDHFSLRWTRRLIDRQIRVFCHADNSAMLRGWLEPEAAGQVVGFERPFAPLAGLDVTPLCVPHDDGCCCAFVLEGFGVRIGYATDLGRVPDALIEHFRDLDVLAIESNYDPRMQLDSPRPWFLKRRIMNGRGHLSNQQAFHAVRQILDGHENRRSPLPAHVVLLHRSRQCNCARLVRNLFSRDKRLAGRLTLAEQFERSAWLRVKKLAPLVGEQLELVWGGESC
ncbi:MAG TPA: MBL fold metallo-hydrolase [Tepidisphaeraceae bacterium]|nr:MBL fold metallo-hydrolase [Tepidisphaeraceae bacterium]